jgi:hypothetical protein
MQKLSPLDIPELREMILGFVFGRVRPPLAYGGWENGRPGFDPALLRVSRAFYAVLHADLYRTIDLSRLGWPWGLRFLEMLESLTPSRFDPPNIRSLHLKMYNDGEELLIRLASVMEGSPPFACRIRELSFECNYWRCDSAVGADCAGIIVACPALERVQLHRWDEVTVHGLLSRLDLHATSSETVRTALRRLIIDVDTEALNGLRNQQVSNVRFKALRLLQAHSLGDAADSLRLAELIVDILLPCDQGGNTRAPLFDSLIFGRLTEPAIKSAPLPAQRLWALVQRFSRDKAGSLSCTVVFPSDVAIERLLDQNALYRARGIDAVIEQYRALGRQWTT